MKIRQKINNKINERVQVLCTPIINKLIVICFEMQKQQINCDYISYINALLNVLHNEALVNEILVRNAEMLEYLNADRKENDR